MKTQMILRLDEDTKTRFDRLARQEGKTSSQMVRELMATYIAEHNPAAAIDRLWARIGGALQAAGTREADVAKAVRHVRRKKK